MSKKAIGLQAYRDFIESMPDSALIVDAAGRILMANALAGRMFGCASEELTGRLIKNLVPRGSRDAHSQKCADFFNEPRTMPMGGAHAEIFGRRQDGSEFPADISLSPVDTDVGLVAMAAVRDITDRKATEAKIAHIAYHDLLTGLPNRALLKDRLDQALAYAERSRQILGVMHLGLDQFKMINDAFGHGVGDALLKDVAGRLGRGLRKQDSIARVGGDEFGIVLPSINQAQDAAKVAQSLLADLAEPFRPEGKEIFISAGLGISLYPADGTRSEELTTNAEHAMRDAKRRGRNNYQFFTSALQAKVTERLALENSLIHALERHEFAAFYQPHIDISSGKIIGMEALARWEHPQRGRIMPDDFIPLAEETGLVAAVGEEILMAAAEQTKAWRDAGYRSLVVAVNLSAVQLQAGNIQDIVEKVLKRTGLPAHYLELELTETAIMENVEVSTKALRALKDIGVHIAIDDFGTGYSSLASLVNFPFDTLKIDRSFIKNMTANNKSAAVVRAIISMAHTLRLKVIAEGVETLEQLEFLRSIKSDAFQGFFFSAAVAAEDFEVLLKEEQRWPIRRVA